MVRLGTAMVSPEDQPAIVPTVIAAAATTLAVEPDSVQVVRWQAVNWPNSSLGCPKPGVAYLQVITPGWLVVVSAADRTLEYHTDQRARVVLCEGFRPRLPPLDRT